MSSAVGYGHEVWSAAGCYFRIPIVASFLGYAFGAKFYDVVIYTGPKIPINTPWLGSKRLMQRDIPSRKKESSNVSF